MDDVRFVPTPMYGYLAVVAAAGPVAAIAVAFMAGAQLTGVNLPRTALLVALAALAERYPIHLTHKTSINAASAAYVAMVLTLPLALCGLFALMAIVAGQVMRQADPVEAAFNVGQCTLYVIAGALTYWFVNGLVPLGPPWVDPAITIVTASAAMHLVNSLLVSVAAAFQMGLNPLRIWLSNIAIEDLVSHAALTGVGVLGAFLVRDYPLALPALVLPAVLVQQSIRQTVKLRADTHDALAALVNVVELRDPYTAGHSRRVAETARVLALRLGMTPEEADIVESAGKVHDIGKIAIDPAIIAKPDRLTDDEWAQMKLHPAHSANTISHFEAYIPCVGMVRHHHEGWDGQGYPDGLTGVAIPLGARILAVADTYDALTSDRPYRAGMSAAHAIEILERGSGTQWDSRVVATMVQYLIEHAGEVETSPGIERADHVPA